MKKVILTGVLATLTAMFNGTFAQNDLSFQWSVPIQNTNACRVFDIQTDGTYIYAVGDYKGTVNFDPNGATATNLTSSGSFTHGYLAKYDQAGNLIWATETSWFHGASFNSYDFKLSINPASGRMVVSKTSTNGGDERNSALVYDGSGTKLWEIFLIVGGYDPWDFKGATIDGNDNIFIFGTVPGGASSLAYWEIDAAGGLTTINPANALGGSVESNVIMKIGPDHSQKFFKKYNNGGVGHGATIEDLKFQGGSLYMVGKHGIFWETDFFGIEIRNPSNSPSVFSSYGYLMKLDTTNATPIWVKTVGSVQMNETLRALYVDGTSIYTVGRSEDHISPTSSGGDFFISVRAQNGAGSFLGAYWRGNKTFAQRWDMNGIVNWGRVMHGSHQSHSVHGLSIQGNASHIAVGGIFSNTITFSGTDTRTAVGSYDGFTSLYDATDGSYQNTFTYGSSSDDRMNAVALIGDDLYTGGYFYSTIDQDLSSNTSNLTSLGSRDGLFMKHSIVTPMTDCGLPAATISGFINLSHHGTTIQWNSADLPAGGKFVVRYHEFGNSPNFSWKTISSETANSAYINNLDPNTRYVFRVGTKCGIQTQALYSDTMSVWTKKYCPKPTGLGATPTLSSATISWDDMGADEYKVRLREVGGGNWRSRTTAATSATFNNLSSSSQYEWQVRAVCFGGGSKSYTALQSFLTPSVRLAGNSEVEDETNGFSLYPNPTSGSIFVEFDSNTKSTLTITVLDMSGRMVALQRISSKDGANRVELDMNGLSKGIYHVRISDRNRQSIVMERVVKQ